MNKIFATLLTLASISAFASEIKINCKSTQAIVGDSVLELKADILEDYKLSNVVISLGGLVTAPRDFNDSFGPRDLSVGAFTTFSDPSRILSLALYLPAYKVAYENRESLTGQIFSNDFRSTLDCDISKL